MRANLLVGVAMKLLEQTVAAFGASTDEGKAVLSSLRSLGAKFGGMPASPKLVQSEIQTLTQGALPMPAVTPEQRQQFMAQTQPRLAPGGPMPPAA